MLEMETPIIGCGNRLVTVQFRNVKRKKKVERFVVLHCAGYTDTIRREAFKELVASNKRYRKRNHIKPTAEVIPFPTRPKIPDAGQRLCWNGMG